METFCWTGAIALPLFVMVLVGAGEARPTPSIRELPNGTYIYAKRLPDRRQPKESWLAGVEIYAFRKRGPELLGEVFLANSDAMTCFRGQLQGNVLYARGLAMDYEDPEQAEIFDFEVDLRDLHPLKATDIPYAAGSVARCTKQFQRFAGGRRQSRLPVPSGWEVKSRSECLTFVCLGEKDGRQRLEQRL